MSHTMHEHIDKENEQDLILEIILQDVKNLTPLDELINKIESRYKDELSIRERSFIECKYVDICLAEFIQEVLLYLEENIEEISRDLNSFFDDFESENEIPKCFSHIKYFPLLDKIQLDMPYIYNMQRQQFIATLKRECFRLIESEIRTLNAEIDFVNETKITLRNIFVNLPEDNEKSEKGRELVEAFNGFDLGLKVCSFIEYLKKSSWPDFEALKGKALALDDEDDFTLATRELNKLFEQFHSETELEIQNDNNGKLLVFKGGFIRLTDLEEKADRTDVYEIRIIAKQIICIDIDLSFPGVNIVMVCPEVFVSGQRTIDVSGVDGEKLEVAKVCDGKGKGAHGNAGEIGNSGRAGGNVVVYTKCFVNDKYLTIKSNGGTGQKGQDGGNGTDGADGKDGYEISRSEFDEKYPKSTTSVEFIKDGLTWVGWMMGGLSDNFYEKTTDKGCRVIYSRYRGIFSFVGAPQFQGYCIHLGGEGTKGGQGGMGGRGGKAGSGGCAGTVEIMCKGHRVNIERKKGRDGENGKDGRGGKGGYNGRRGLDIGRVEPNQYRDVRSYGPARLSLEYMSSDSEDFAYCPHESERCGSSRYATIREMSREKGSRVRCHGERTEKNEERMDAQRDVRQHERSVPISSKAIVNTYKNIVETESTVLHMRDTESLQIEATRESSKKYTHIKSSYPSLKRQKVIQIKSVEKAMADSNKQFSVGQSLCYTSEIRDQVKTIVYLLKGNAHGRLIKMIASIEETITACPLDSPEHIPNLFDPFIAITADQSYFQKFQSKLGRHADILMLFNNQLNKLQVIALQKYKFACLEILAKKIEELAVLQYKRSEEACRVRVMSIIKMRLIHLCYDIVEGMWGLPEMKEVSSFSVSFRQEVYFDLSNICSTLNDFERLQNSGEAEVIFSKHGDQDTGIEEEPELEQGSQDDCLSQDRQKENLGSPLVCQDIEKAPPKSTKLTTEKASPKSTKQTTEKASPKSTKPTTEMASPKSTKQATEMAPPKSTKQTTEMAPPKNTKQTTEMELLKSVKQATEKAPPKSIKNANMSTEPTTENPKFSSESSGLLEMVDGGFQEDERKQNFKIIEKYYDEITKNKKDPRYSEALESLRMLVYIDSNLIELLLEVLTRKLLVDGFHLSSSLFMWFISRILEQTDEQSLKIFVWIISAKPMVNWLAEYTVLQLIYQDKLAIQSEAAVREYLYSLEDKQWIPVVWRHVFNNDITFKDDDNKLEQLLSALTLLRKEPFDNDLMQELADKDLSQWPDILMDYNSLKLLLDLPVEWTKHELIEADAYVDELRKTHGDDIVEIFLKNLKKAKKLSPETVNHLLRNFYHEVWPFTLTTLEKVKNEKVNSWEAKLNELCSSDAERSLEQLIELMIGDSNGSPCLVPSSGSSSRGDFDIEHVLRQSILNEDKVIKTFGRNFSVNWVNDFDGKIKLMPAREKVYYKEVVRKWAKGFRERVKPLSKKEREEFLSKNITEVFAHVEIGLSLMSGFKLRQAQRLSVILLVHSNSQGLLEQVSTGEGKTIIIVAFCIIKNLIGHTVDVITSSPVLAERDAARNSEFLELFGTSVSHNCSEDIQKRAEAYKKDIVYGEIGSFQRDVLLQQFYNESTLGKRGFDTIVVDEVDSMLLDKAENVLYLSHDISDFDGLEPVFVYIWSFVHGKGLIGTEEDMELVKAAIMNAIYGTFRKDDLEKSLSFLPENEIISDVVDVILQELHDMKVLDQKGRIRCLSDIKNNKIELGLNEKLKLDASDIDGAVLNFLKDISRQGIQIEVPNYLEQFIYLHLSDWIKSAFSARFMQERRHYVIDIDRSDTEFGESANVVIIDVDTGVEQSNMQWSNGLHQFLQLKHGCRISVENLKAVFMSNLAFFKLYDRSIYGLTGTLGSQKERDSLKELYGINYVNVPTFRPKRFVYHEGRLFDSEEVWIEKSVGVAVKIAKQRPVLMICNTIRDLEKFRREFLTVKKSSDFELHVYKSSYEALDIVNEGKMIKKGCVILATNLAGRGTDLKISQNMNKKGGLHVILTYLPRNTRIEEQAFGRAARKGQNGSGQLCIMNTNNKIKGQSSLVTILLMAKERNAEEKQRLNFMKEHYETFIKREEDYFKKFKVLYGKFQNALEKTEDSEKEVILHACLDRWAFWLDGVGKTLGTEDEDTESHWMKFERRMASECALSLAKLTSKSPSLRVKLGIAYIKNKKYPEAMEIFQDVIADEPKFSESAHYYYAHCVIKSKGLESSVEERRLSYHLLKAEKGFKKRIEVFSQLNNMVDLIKKFYGKDIEHFVMNDAYEQQKTDLINILGVFCDSVRNILGHAVDVNALDNVLQDAALAAKIIENKEIFQGSKFTDFMEEQMANLFQRYELYSHELGAKISYLRGKSKEVKAEDFECVLPSRNEFWCELSRSNLLCGEKEYIIVDMKKAESISLKKEYRQNNMSELKKLSCNDFKNLFQNRGVELPTGNEPRTGNKPPRRNEPPTGNGLHAGNESPTENKPYTGNKPTGNKPHTGNEHHAGNDPSMGNDPSRAVQFEQHSKTILICMFPGHVKEISDGNYIAIPSENFQHGEFRKILENSGAIYTNKIAHLNKDDARVCKLAKYDGISEHNLCEIQGVNRIIAKEIFNYLQEAGLLESDVPKIHEIDLPRHKRFETEVKNLLSKHYAYRILLLQTINANNIDELPFEQLNSNPHRLIWNDLVELNIVNPLRVKDSVSEEYAQTNIDNEQSVLTIAWDKLGYFFEMKEISSVASAINNWRAGIFKYETVDSSLTDVRDMLSEKTIQDASVELDLFASKGFDLIVVLEEKKWSTRIILRIGAIIVIGMAQIALGIILEVFSVGFGTFIAAGLIEEGISDIMFAIECAFSGHCTWKDYLTNKAVSVAFAVLTGGVGAFFARGAKYSRYGYKIAGEHLIEKVGVELVKKTTKTRLVKECAKMAGKKVLKGVAMGLAIGAVNKAVDVLLRDRLTEMCKSICSSLKDDEKYKKNRQLIDELCKNVGSREAKMITTKVGQVLLKSKENYLVNKTLNVFQEICKGMDEALGKLKKVQGRESDYAKLLTVVSSVLTVASCASAVYEMYDMCKSYSETLPGLLQGELDKLEKNAHKNESKVGKLEKNAHENESKVDKLQKNAHGNGSEVDKLDKNCHEHESKLDQLDKNAHESNERDAIVILNELMNELSRHVENILENKLIKRFLHYCTKELVMATGKWIKEMKSKFDTSKHRKALDKIIKQKTSQGRPEVCEDTEGHKVETGESLEESNITDYQSSLVKLQRKVRDPDLYVELIRQDIPMGVHEAQALSNIIGRSVHVKYVGDGTEILPLKFTPTSASNGKPVVIYFKAHGNKGVGHFSDSPDFNSSKSTDKNSCLLDTVCRITGEKIDRDQVADFIKKDKGIRGAIERNIHRHFIERRGTGGVMRDEKRKTKVKELIEDIKNQEGKVTDKQKKLLLDKAGRAGSIDKFVYKTGNHELLPRALIDKWKELDLVEEHMYLRVDIRYAVFFKGEQDKQGLQDGHDMQGMYDLQGRPLSVFSNPKNPKCSQKTVGSKKQLHTPNIDEISKCQTKLQTEQVILENYLKVIRPTKDVLDSMLNKPEKAKMLKNTYTSTGHDLSKPEQLRSFLTGLSREVFKIEALVERSKCLEKVAYKYPSPGEDYYCKRILQMVKSSDTLEKRADILMKPPPCGFRWKTNPSIGKKTIPKIVKEPICRKTNRRTSL